MQPVCCEVTTWYVVLTFLKEWASFRKQKMENAEVWVDFLKTALPCGTWVAALLDSVIRVYDDKVTHAVQVRVCEHSSRGCSDKLNQSALSRLCWLAFRANIAQHL